MFRLPTSNKVTLLKKNNNNNKNGRMSGYDDKTCMSDV